MAKVEVLPPHGFIELKKWSGDEVDIVNAARVSFGNEISELEDRDVGLLNFLLKNHHGTPFEQGMLAHWHIKCPLFVARQWFKHRVGVSYNEVSGRYSELKPEWYIPERARTQTGKPGSYSFEELDHPTSQAVANIMQAGSFQAFERYKRLLKMGVAKEQARIVLPQNMYTEFRWTTNARSLMHFLSLRNDTDAQKEIRLYGEALEQEFAKSLPNVYAKFVENGREKP